MEMGLVGRRALVLGGSKGLGFAIAKGLAGEGAKVALVSRTAEKAGAAAASIGPDVLGLACDTARADQIDALHEAVAKAFGGIDILVLNSGGPPPGAARGVSGDQWRASFDSMFVNLVRMADLALPGMIEARFGRIISVISSGVIQPIPNLAISNAIRPALVGWGKTLAAEVAQHGVTVNAIAPGRIATDRLAELDAANAKRTSREIDQVRTAAKAAIPAGRYGDPDEFAAAAVFLASARASFITGSILRVDGGQISSH
jgi:3-oxoacyl-[acyl-carrier protein] reductase